MKNINQTVNVDQKALDKEKQLKRILKTSNESLTFIAFLQKKWKYRTVECNERLHYLLNIEK